MSIRALLPMLVLLTGCSSQPYYDSPPLKPENLTPLVGADVVINAQTRFSWTAVETASHYDFHVFDRSNGDIGKYYRQAMYAADICDRDECSIEVSVALPYLDSHAWRVRAGNSAGKSQWTRSLFNLVHSGVGPVTTQAADKPLPLAPLGGDLAAGDMMAFEWQASAFATSYDFHLFNRADGSLVHELHDLPESTICLEDNRCQLVRSVSLPPADGHAWRVRAINKFGRSEWTRTEFSVVP